MARFTTGNFENNSSTSWHWRLSQTGYANTDGVTTADINAILSDSLVYYNSSNSPSNWYYGSFNHNGIDLHKHIGMHYEYKIIDIGSNNTPNYKIKVNIWLC